VNEAAWLQAGAWMNLKWDRHPVDPPVLAAWYVGVAMYEQGDAMAAMDRLAEPSAERPTSPNCWPKSRPIGENTGPNYWPNRGRSPVSTTPPGGNS
jgi:hypothetical protein